jgi:hypothetical protein
MQNKKEKDCPLCDVSEKTIGVLKENGREKYLSKKENKDKERILRIRQRKVKKISFVALAVALIAVGTFTWFSYSPSVDNAERQEITVFYSPDCSCCGQYIPYLKRNGFEVSGEKDMARRIDVLEEFQVPYEMTSCHTALVGNYFVEGHVPAEIIKKLLEEKPEIDGITLPGMPQGSPGMPGIKTEKWTIYGFSGGISSEFMVY